MLTFLQLGKFLPPILLGAAGALLLAPLACSLTRSKANCESTTECKEAFGTGFVCSKEGICEQAAIEASCQTQTPHNLLLSPEKNKNRIVLGSLLRAAGKEGARHDSVQLALESVNTFLERNESQNKNNFPELENLRFGLVQCDHEGNTEEIANLAQYLVETLEVPAIIGPASSSGTDRAFRRVNLGAEEVELQKVLFMSPSATSVSLSSLETTQPGVLWRTAPMDDGQGLLMGTYAKNSSVKFAVIYEDTPYGKGLYKELMATSGSTCANCSVTFPADKSDAAALGLALATDEARAALEGAEIVFFIGAQEKHIKAMMGRLGEPEFKGRVFFFSDAAASQDHVRVVPADYYKNVVGTRTRSPKDTEALRLFTSAYSFRHEEPPLIHSFTANAYDAAWLVLVSAMGARLSGKEITPSTLARHLGHLSDTHWASLPEKQCPSKFQDENCPPITLSANNLPLILRTLAQRGAVDVEGASGDLNYCPNSEELERSSAAFELWHLEPLEDQMGYEIVADAAPLPPQLLPPCPD